MSADAAVWCVMPVLAGPEMTEAALADLLAQSIPTRVLIVNQGVDSEFRDRLERLAEQEDRIFLWHHQPSLPSLSATWNRALDWIFGMGEPCAFVVNNDVRLHRETIEWLIQVMAREDAYFVSAVGVTAEQFTATQATTYSDYDFWDAHSDEPSRAGQLLKKGGPDFSCYLIGADCFSKYRFDEHFIPAFCEDLDYHRRLMLGGDGSRIFSISLPYLHLASQTLKQIDPDEATKIKQSIDRHSRAHYARKWGGPVNEETFMTPFGGGFSEPDKVEGIYATTPYLQAMGRATTSEEAAHGQDDRRAEPDGRPDPTSETARPEGL